jgi:streptogrisin C
VQRVCLDGPTGTDYDAYLQKLSGSTWTNVASGTTAGADEAFTYSGTAGTYRVRVHAYSGSGTYRLGLTRP